MKPPSTRLGASASRPAGRTSFRNRPWYLPSTTETRWPGQITAFSSKTLPSRKRVRILPGGKEKIIDSKVPFWGDVSDRSQEGKISFQTSCLSELKPCHSPASPPMYITEVILHSNFSKLYLPVPREARACSQHQWGCHIRTFQSNVCRWSWPALHITSTHVCHQVGMSQDRPRFPPPKKTTKCFMLEGNCWICGGPKFQEGFGVSRRWELRSWEVNINHNKYIMDKIIL